jgi:hypothetical protein
MGRKQEKIRRAAYRRGAAQLLRVAGFLTVLAAFS